MTPAPVAAAGAATVIERGPTWSSEFRSWLPSLIIGLVVIVAIIGALVFAVGYAVNWLDGSCEEDGYETLAGCAIGGPTGNLLATIGGAGFALTPAGFLTNLFSPYRIDGSGLTYQGPWWSRAWRRLRG